MKAEQIAKQDSIKVGDYVKITPFNKQTIWYHTKMMKVLEIVQRPGKYDVFIVNWNFKSTPINKIHFENVYKDNECLEKRLRDDKLIRILKQK